MVCMVRWCCAVLACLPISASAVSIDWVPVGNAGNPADITGHGAVNYDYSMSAYEITNAQYVEFLNAIAATDTYGVYNDSMTGYTQSGILRAGAPGSYTYSVKPPVPGVGINGAPYTFEDKPIANVSYYDAARFANWLNNGQPTGLQDASTTEDGAYTFTGAAEVGSRNPDARVFIPSEDEWYKAAFYSPHKGGPGVGGYYNYPTQSDLAPNNNLPTADTGNSANFFISDFTTGNGNYPMTSVGAYALSASAYGTFDQGGNVQEWTEAIVIDNIYGPSRILRGGDWNNPLSLLNADNSLFTPGGNTGRNLGFRVASIPEPSAFALAALGAAGLAVVRRRRGNVKPAAEWRSNG